MQVSAGSASGGRMGWGGSSQRGKAVALLRHTGLVPLSNSKSAPLALEFLIYMITFGLFFDSSQFKAIDNICPVSVLGNISGNSRDDSSQWPIAFWNRLLPSWPLVVLVEREWIWLCVGQCLSPSCALPGHIPQHTQHTHQPKGSPLSWPSPWVAQEQSWHPARHLGVEVEGSAFLLPGAGCWGLASALVLWSFSFLAWTFRSSV